MGFSNLNHEHLTTVHLPSHLSDQFPVGYGVKNPFAMKQCPALF